MTEGWAGLALATEPDWSAPPVGATSPGPSKPYGIVNTGPVRPLSSRDEGIASTA